MNHVDQDLSYGKREEGGLICGAAVRRSYRAFARQAWNRETASSFSLSFSAENRRFSTSFFVLCRYRKKAFIIFFFREDRILDKWRRMILMDGKGRSINLSFERTNNFFKIGIGFFWIWKWKCKKIYLIDLCQIYVCVLKISRSWSRIRKCETRCKYTCKYMDCNTRVKCKIHVYITRILCILVPFRAINNQTWTHFIWNSKLKIESIFLNDFNLRCIAKSIILNEFFLIKIGYNFWINCKKNFGIV